MRLVNFLLNEIYVLAKTDTCWFDINMIKRYHDYVNMAQNVSDFKLHVNVSCVYTIVRLHVKSCINRTLTSTRCSQVNGTDSQTNCWNFPPRFGSDDCCMDVVGITICQVDTHFPTGNKAEAEIIKKVVIL